MSAPTKSYYIDINRFSAQDSESDQTNIWDYNLNDTIVAPMGSEISIHQAFLNQKGITGQSIEFEEDITETIYYYTYISEMEQAVPVLQDPVLTKRGERHNINEQEWGYLNLLNNAASGATSGRGKGRYGLWDMNDSGILTEGTVYHIDAQKFGGSGAPLILSDPPDPDSNTEFPINVYITPPNSLVGTLTLTPASGLNTFIATRDSMINLVLASGRLRGISTNRVHFGQNTNLPVADNFTKVYGSDSHLEIATLDTDVSSATFGHGTFSQGWTVAGDNTIREYTVPVYNAWGDGSGAAIAGVAANSGKGTASETSNLFQKGRVDLLQSGYKAIPQKDGRVPRVGDRVYDRVGNTIIPMGCKVQSVEADGTGFFVENAAGQLIDFASNGTTAALDRVKTNVDIFLNDDTNYYCSPRPLSAQIKVPKGIYGIQQLVSLINNQLSGLAAVDSKVPQKPYDSGLLSGDYDGMINQGTQGFTTKIKPIAYRDSPDSVHLTEINPDENAVLGNTIPDHTFISAYDYAINRVNTQALNDKNRVNFTTKISGTGFIGYLMNNDFQNCEKDGLTLKTITKAYGVNGTQLNSVLTPANCVSGGAEDSSTSSKAISDYIINNITVGAPEANIQFNTDNSSFSINNLHASWRIPSHDILGQPIINAGEVGVGLKRCAEICDAQPYTEFQKIWGAEGRDNLHTGANSQDVLRGRCVPDTNIIDSIGFGDQEGQGGAATMSFMTLGAKISPVDAAPHGNSSDKLPNADGTNFVEIIEIIPASLRTSESSGSKGYANPDDPLGFYSVRVKFPSSWNSNKQVFKTGNTDDRICFTITSQMSGTTTEHKQMISSFQRPKSRIGGAIVYNFAQQTGIKYGDRPSVVDDPVYNQHASYNEFFTSRKQAEKIWKTKTLWGKLGFSYKQFNEEDYFENIIQYCQPNTFKLRGITTDTVLDGSTIPTISSLNNPSDFSIEPIYGSKEVSAPRVYNNFDINIPRTELQRDYPDGSQGSQMNMKGSNQQSYSGSIHTMTTMVNVVAKPTPMNAEGLPTLSKFGYYLITSDLVPTYKDIVSKGDPLGLLGVVAKTSLSSQDFIPLADSDIVQVLNQDTQINNIRVKVLNPDLTNPELNENSSVILRIDVPIEVPPRSTETETKKPKKKCPKTGGHICKCPPTSIEKISKK